MRNDERGWQRVHVGWCAVLTAIAIILSSDQWVNGSTLYSRRVVVPLDKTLYDGIYG